MRSIRWSLLAALLALALVGAACASSDDDGGQADSRPAEPGGDDGPSEPGPDADPDDPADPDDDLADPDPDPDAGSGDSDDPDPDGGDDDAGASDLVWTVVAVEFDDTLNLRAEPSASAPVLTEFLPWTTGLRVVGDDGDDPPRWRQLELPDGTVGWVNSRFLVGQPANLSGAEAEAAEAVGVEFLDWARSGGSPDNLLAPRSVWMGGIGIYADAGSQWNWVAADDLATEAQWNTERDFVVEPGLDCGSDCTLSARDFLNLDRLDDTTRVLLDDIPPENQAFLEGMLWEAPSSLHRLVLDTPTTDETQTFDWQRLHLVLDWSGGEPRVHLIHNHGWTP